LGALVDAGASLESIQAGVASLGLPRVRLLSAEVKKNGFRATQITVEHQPQQHHRHLRHITAMIDGSSLTDRQKELAKRIFGRLAEAEAKVHGVDVRQVHFHEVGAVDSIADIVGAAIGWDLLGIGAAVASPIPTGTGFIEIAHGRCSIPAPATAELLRGVPLAASNVPHELTTPTGAAILSALVTEYGPPPAMTIETIGYGAGQRDLESQPNLLRLLIGEPAPIVTAEQLWMLETNLDDISGELVGYATHKLWEAGALDVFTTAIQMKKGRPGVTLSALCRAADCQAIETALFRETTTFGVRRYAVLRNKLRREKQAVDTPWGSVEGTVAWLAGERVSFAPEFESCRQIAEQHGAPLKQVYEAAQKAFHAERLI
jgi:uncharacterized protein (TIGR00299 family) protein